MTLERVKEIIINLDIDEIKNAVQSEIDDGVAPQDIVKTLSDGMDEVGKLYEKKEFFLTDLILAGETMKDAMKILNPHLKVGEQSSKGIVISATVEGDNHDIGKNILNTLLLSAGFEVIDLGINIPAEKIVKAVKESEVKVVALSCLLTMTIKEIGVVVKALEAAGLRDKVKIIVGGAPMDMETAKSMGADDFSADAVDGVKHIKMLMEE